MRRSETVRKLVTAGLMAALVFLGSMLRITLPVNVGTTSFHLGNLMCALSGMTLGPVAGGLASGIGSLLYDWINPLYVAESWITLLTKGAYGLAVGLVAWSGGRGKPLSYFRGTAAAATGAVVYAALYLFKAFAWDGLFLGGLQAAPAAAAVVTKLPATAFNAVVAIVLAPPLFFSIGKSMGRGFRP